MGFVDPPGPICLDGHYFHAWCPFIRPSVRLSQKNVTELKKKNHTATKHVTTLHGSWSGPGGPLKSFARLVNLIYFKDLFSSEIVKFMINNLTSILAILRTALFLNEFRQVAKFQTG